MAATIDLDFVPKINTSSWPFLLTKLHHSRLIYLFSNFSCRYLNPIIFSNLNSDSSKVLDLRNLQEPIQKAVCFKNCTDLSLFELGLIRINSRPSASNFKSFSWSLEHQLFLIVGRNNFGNKIPYITEKYFSLHNFIIMIWQILKLPWLLCLEYENKYWWNQIAVARRVQKLDSKLYFKIILIFCTWWNWRNL